jgi:hypothetical protein
MAIGKRETRRAIVMRWAPSHPRRPDFTPADSPGDVLSRPHDEGPDQPWH